MPSLQSVDDRFASRFEVLEGGSGTFSGIVNEPDQGQAPSYQFNLPRRLLRVHASLPVSAGMVIRSPEGTVWMLGKHGDSESPLGALFRNFRMFEADQLYRWERRVKVLDPVTKLPRDEAPQLQREIWAAYEPSAGETADRQLRVNFETGRLITTAPVERDDIVDGKRVTRCDIQLGLYVASLG